MPTYRINPYISFIENRLFPGVVQRAVFHRLTGEIIEHDFTAVLNGDSPEVRQLVQSAFLIPEGYDPLTPLLDQYVARPMQNPAVMYRSESGEWLLVRTSMNQLVYSPKLDELPEVIEEKLSPLAAEILLLADGTRTLRQVFENVSENPEFNAALDFLTSQERQLIRVTARLEELDQPFSTLNIVPRNLYHSERKPDPITEFHLTGIEDASWEFDFIEPTVNHGFRFPHEALGGLDYGSRFCLATLTPEVVPLIVERSPLRVLEVGGGTGSFARAFIKQAASKADVEYHILDLSPTLMENQRKVLAEVLPEARHFHQDATRFDLDQRFDLIVSNEVIADFPVASAQRNASGKWEGEGASDIEKYDLADKEAPDSLLVNAGVFRFLERAWKHLNPGGTLLVSEYGSEYRYAARSFNLNHDEYTIHFGHLVSCAARVGFQTRLLTLKEFVGFDDDVAVLEGREEHLVCLNHVLKNYGVTLPFAVISKSDFEKRCAGIVEEAGLIGYSFSPLHKGFYFGPNINDFYVLIMHKPKES